MLIYDNKKYELIEKRCECGCELTFRCLETSKQQYFSRTHDPAWTGKRNHGQFMALIKKNQVAYHERKRKFQKFYKKEKEKDPIYEEEFKIMDFY